MFFTDYFVFSRKAMDHVHLVLQSVGVLHYCNNGTTDRVHLVLHCIDVALLQYQRHRSGSHVAVPLPPLLLYCQACLRIADSFFSKFYI